MGYHLDGRASLCFGTHTHVVTADERILPRGTAYITDVGMVGAIDSIIGVNKDEIIQNYLLGIPQRFQVAKDNIRANCVIIDFDEATGDARSITRYNF